MKIPEMTAPARDGYMRKCSHKTLPTWHKVCWDGHNNDNVPGVTTQL